MTPCVVGVKEPHTTNDVLLVSSQGGSKGPKGANAQVWLDLTDHAGNRLFRKILEDSLQEYTSKGRLEQTLITVRILKEWRAQQPPGRFLQRDSSATDALWYDVGDRRAQGKISKALKRLVGNDDNGTGNAPELEASEQNVDSSVAINDGNGTGNAPEVEACEQQDVSSGAIESPLAAFTEQEMKCSHEDHVILNSTNEIQNTSTRNTKDLSMTFARLGKQLPNGLGPRRISHQLNRSAEVGTLYGRADEQEQLVAIYKQRKEQHQKHLRQRQEQQQPTLIDNEDKSFDPLDFVLITGSTGTGKTAMALSLRAHLQSDANTTKQAFFIQTKFEQLNSPDPTTPFLAACADFCRQCLHRHRSNPLILQKYANTILEALAGEHSLLASRVPELQELLNVSGNELGHYNAKMKKRDSTENKRGAMSKKRLKYALRLFFRAVCSAAPKPIVFFIDDLHWAQEASLDILTYLCTDTSNQGILFVATHLQDPTFEWKNDRGDIDKCDLEAREQSWSSVSNTPTDSSRRLNHSIHPLLQKDELNAHYIQLGTLSKEAVHSMLLGTLLIEPMHTAHLVEIVYSITKGNVLFIKEVLRALQENDVLQFDERSKQWICESTMILNALDVKNVEDLLRQKILDLDDDVQEVLKVAAFLGSQTVDEGLLGMLCPEPVTTHLEVAIGCGLLVRRSKVWGAGEVVAFAHDGVQRAAYNLESVDNRASTHLRIGHELWEAVERESLDEYITVVAHQCMLGSSCLNSNNDRATVALLCLQAGEKAVRSSSFQTASVYLMHGVSLMKEGGSRSWRDNYDLCLRLHTSAAEVCYCNMEFDKLSELFEAVLSNARNFEDTIHTRSTQIYALGSRGNLEEAIDIGLSTLKGLGEEIPSRLTSVRALWALHKVQRILKRYTDEGILRLPLLEDSRIQSILLVMNHTILYCFFKNPMVSVYLVSRMVLLTFKHGLCPVSAMGFAFTSCFISA